jgi:hypothetical protein
MSSIRAGPQRAAGASSPAGRPSASGAVLLTATQYAQAGPPSLTETHEHQ